MPIRLNILFFVVFLLFSALILRLGVVQIVQGEDYQRKIERTVNVIAKNDAPRGFFYDRYGNILVDNRLQLSVTYTNRNTSNDEKIRVAKRLNELIEVDTSSVTERDMKDYWILTRRDEANELVTKEEMAQLDHDNMAIYRLQLDKITKEHLAELTDEELEIVAIKREFDRGYAHTPQRVAQVSYEEAARVLEHLSELPGVDLLRDAERNYLYGQSFRQLFGGVGSIHKDLIDTFLARGYYRSDLVGTSQLEQQYEDVLKGNKGVLEHVLDGSGRAVDQPIERPGQRGKDLVLTVDMEFQQIVEKVVLEEIERLRSMNGFLGQPSAYAVLLDPQTGEILAMSGYREDEKTKELQVYDLGNVYNAFEMGSAVKGASVLAGFQGGYAHAGKVFNDRPIVIGNTRKSSFGGGAMGRINDLTALERSSNVYMFEIAMAFGNYNYNTRAGGGLKDRTIGFNQMRYYFNQFGLGVKTGIDLPSESTGYNGGVQQLGNLLDFSIGQFDTYTPLQMAQYVSTIANGGYRIQPRLVREIREPSTQEDELGNVIKQFTPNVLNRVDMSDEDMKRVQEGFRLVMHGSRGTARNFADKPYEAAGKTGTAQIRIKGQEGTNQTLVGYAPFDNPEIAFAVIVPNLKAINSVGRPANTISERILDAYFELKQKRNGPRLPSTEDTNVDALSEDDEENN